MCAIIVFRLFSILPEPGGNKLGWRPNFPNRYYHIIYHVLCGAPAIVKTNHYMYVDAKRKDSEMATVHDEHMSVIYRERD